MLTADPCQPMPGPMGAVWPSAKPGIDYCGPYPACCPPVAQSWWQHLAGSFNPHGDWSMIALEVFCAAFFVVFVVLAVVGRAQWRRYDQARMSRRDT
jgi:hypothetical protein